MLTQVGLVFGSPLYMSPEQSLGLPTDQTTDIYSFGCALVESLIGEPPFLGANSFATMVAHQSVRPPKLSDRKPDVNFPRRLESLVACLLEKDRTLRFQTFGEVKEELEAVLFALNAERAARGGESATLPAQPRKISVPRGTTKTKAFKPVFLDMQWCQVTDSDMACLSHFNKLERLQINYGEVTDAGLAYLRDLPRLSFIKIGSNKMSSASIDTFAHMPALRRLIVGTHNWPIAMRAKLAAEMRAKNIQFEGTDH
ncbi:MAG: hypothetical protein KGS72_22340 [Cyanobacteria bacterium REEB67]|nr:hypothetical protein [Cyanobacteria bacterium REEB67]